jgi:hypothetical protein
VRRFVASSQRAARARELVVYASSDLGESVAEIGDEELAGWTDATADWPGASSNPVLAIVG